MSRTKKDPATGTTLSNERMAHAAAAIETIALNNKLMLAAKYDTTAADVMALVSLAKAHWYQLSQEGK